MGLLGFLQLVLRACRGYQVDLLSQLIIQVRCGFCYLKGRGEVINKLEAKEYV